MSPTQRSTFFIQTLPAIILLAFSLPGLMGHTQIPLLFAGSTTHKVTLSQQQIASLLANAFLCTFPRRNKNPKSKKYYFDSNKPNNDNSANNNNEIINEDSLNNLPSINFNSLFGKTGSPTVNKLLCIVNYFKRVVFFICYCYTS